MTKEELEKEAEEYANNLVFVYETDIVQRIVRERVRLALIDVLEPREKQIQIDAEQIRALQKQNGELTDELTKKSDTNHQLIEQMAELNERCFELEAQIEKMKWHKVSDGDLPKDRHNVYVVYMNGCYQLENTIASFRHKYWIINGLKTECEIIAWCELPEWR